MARPLAADAAGSTASPTTSGTGAPATEQPTATATTPPAPTTTAEAPAPVTEEPANSPASAPSPAQEQAPQEFLEQVTDSGLAPPVDDAQKLAMARDICAEMSHGATPDDMVRALAFAGATDEEAANFVQLAVTNICPEYAR
jgi:hypothetical protein